MAHNTLLYYPDLNRKFDIHNNARHLQIVLVISQGGRPIDFTVGKLPDHGIGIMKWKSNYYE